MARISGSKALAAGFGLIVREPAAVLVWCVVSFALTIAPQILTLGPTLAMFGTLAASGGEATSADVLAAQAEVNRYQGIVLLCSLAALTLLPAAVFRAVLFPAERGLMYLKLGAREFWMALIMIVLFVMYFIAILVGMIPIGIVIGVGSVAGGGGSAGVVLLGMVMVFAFIAVLLWGLLRFSMAPIMAFADKTFRLTESWRLTRGHAGKMFLVAAALAVILLVVEMCLFGVFFGWAASMVTMQELTAAPQAALAKLGAPFLAAAGIVFSLLTGAFYAVWYGAWAEMYRQLAEKPEDVFA